jgi:hypothetical protein
MVYSKTENALALWLLVGQKSLLGAPGAASGPFALALSALVAEHSPALSASEKRVVAHLFGGDLNVSFPANQTITVKADSVVCRVSDVDISARSCELTFGAHKHKLKGRAANELYATAVEAGVPSDGAAGSIFESLSQLVCTIDPGQVKQKAGGGANCTFTSGP